MPRREKCAKVFLFSPVGICLCWKLFEFRSIVRIVKCRMSWSWPGWFIDGYCIPPLCSRPKHVFDRLFLTKHCRCFNKVTQGADGAADLLQALSESPLLEELDFQLCYHIPAAAWQKVRNAKWLNLKKANFWECLVERNAQRFCCFLQWVFVSVGSCSSLGASSELWSCRMSWSWPGWV